jgi:hypothetical protein
MPSAVILREDYLAEALRALAPSVEDINQSRRRLSLKPQPVHQSGATPEGAGSQR